MKIGMFVQSVNKEENTEKNGMSYPNPLNVKGFKVKYLGKRIYELTYYDEVNSLYYIGMTGSAVNTFLTINENHRLIKVELKLTDSSNADSTTALTSDLYRAISEGLYLNVWSSTGIEADRFKNFGEGYEYPDMTYKLSATGTNTDRLRVKFTIQLLE